LFSTRIDDDAGSPEPPMLEKVFEMNFSARSVVFRAFQLAF
jgi:hypothetical protein